QRSTPVAARAACSTFRRWPTLPKATVTRFASRHRTTTRHRGCRSRCRSCARTSDDRKSDIVMEVGPYVQDLVTRIINVQWGGAVFIVVAEAPYYVRVTGKNEETGKVIATIQLVELPDSPKGPGQSTSATSYKLIDGKPTFLLCGMVDYKEAADFSSAAAAVVLKSNDGITWRHVFLSETGSDLWEAVGQSYAIVSTPNALVWSNDAFYFDQRVARTGLGTVETPTGPTNWIHEQVFKSANGETWTGPVSDEQVWYGAETKKYRS